jgi:hypothetical protein
MILKEKMKKLIRLLGIINWLVYLAKKRLYVNQLVKKPIYYFLYYRIRVLEDFIDLLESKKVQDQEQIFKLHQKIRSLYNKHCEYIDVKCNIGYTLHQLLEEYHIPF